MSDEPDNLVLVYLRRIDTMLQRVADDVADIKVRVTSLEIAMGGINRRLDRLEERVERIERRLDIIDPAIP